MGHSTLHTDDGIPLTPKEGIIIDAEGRPLTASPERERAQSGFKIISMGKLPWPLALFALVGITIFIPIFIILALVVLAFFVLRIFLRAVI